jgi:serine protease Do
MARSRFVALALVLAAAPGFAADAGVVWDSARTSSPDTVPELKALQEKVKLTVEKRTPSTVGLFVGGGSRSGAGSGVIVSEDGLVLTAAHVIWDAIKHAPFETVRIVLPDGTAVAGKSLGVNTDIDSGMVKIVGKPPRDASWPGAKDGKWPAAPVGKTSDLKRGQWVVSLGHPGGPKVNRPPPVRVGRVENIALEDGTLQTDCTLVGGDSGGPLFDLNGKVVGIHSRIGPVLKVNIHVPVESFRTDWGAMADGKVLGTRRGLTLGFAFDQTAEEAKVAEVTPGGMAAVAGLRPGDVIVLCNGEKVHTPDDFIQVVDGWNGRDELSVDVARGPKTVTLTLHKSQGRPRKK